MSRDIDLGALGSYAAHHSSEPVEAFSIGFDDECRSELPYATIAASAFGANHHTKVMAMTDAERLLPLFPQIYDEPFHDSSGLPTFPGVGHVA